MDQPALTLDIRGLSFSYPDGTEGLRGLDLQVPAGSRLALLGPNGAGKSTLLWHLNGLLRGRGEVRVLGLEVVARNLVALRRQVGLVFQNPDDQLLMPTVADEVAYAALNAGYPAVEVRCRVAAAMASTGVTHLASRNPLNLSIGQKKRVAIASVLVTDSRLLVLDEPSAGLDPAGRRSLLALLRELPGDLVVATHDLALAAQLCDLAAVMAAGRVAHLGPTVDLVSDEVMLAECGL